MVDGKKQYKCNKCGQVKEPSEFYFRDKVPNNFCKPCKKEGIRNSPSAKRRREEARKNKISREAEKKRCERCGKDSLKTDWPRTPSGGLNKTCCRAKQMEKRKDMINSGVCVCGLCNKEKSIDQFTMYRNGKPRSWCKDCHKAYMCQSGSREKRQKQIEETSDGTLDTKAVGELFGRHRDCPCCGKKMKRDEKHMDHITPISKGGSHSIYNVTILCSACNGAKSNKDFIAWFKDLPKDYATRFKNTIEGDENLNNVYREVEQWLQQAE